MAAGAADALAGVPTVLLDERVRVTLLDGPGSGRVGRAVRRQLPGVAGATVSLLPFGGDVEGVTTHGPALPPGGRAARRRPGPRPVQRRTGPDAAVAVRARPAAHHRIGDVSLEAVPAAEGYPRPMSTPQAGDLAPEVALPDETGTVHRLGDRAGRWTVVYFYPQDDTPGCTTEACQFRDLNGDLTGLDAEVWGISPDGSGSHAAFRAKFGLPFTLLSDEDHAVADAYGAWQEKQNYGKTYWGIVRSSYLVGPDGRIATAWPKVKADGHAAAGPRGARSRSAPSRRSERVPEPVAGTRERLRPWGETSEASGANSSTTFLRDIGCRGGDSTTVPTADRRRPPRRG